MKTIIDDAPQSTKRCSRRRHVDAGVEASAAAKSIVRSKESSSIESSVRAALFMPPSAAVGRFFAIE